ncbi:DUF559 domain-containing protein [Streptomyces sp. NP160]|uniref:DUF559 domain-containing protein n=1 Tax=Streptomyces sp. NP160 TaxID=2586637 RepID=UPI00111B589F|nr:DUF559 domain-containing protein [Streptomyces sp. NP160]TNM59689.1 DUF559 domain-containing protein [Streptomyces sp. NP160]
MSRPPAPLPARLRHRSFTVDEALALGVSERRLRAADLRAPHRGVRVSLGVEWTPLVALQCALLAGPEGAVGTGAHAVVALGLPAPFGAPDPTTAEPVLALPRGTRAPRRSGFAVRPARLHPQTRTCRVRGVLLLSPEDLWAQRCGELDEESAVAPGDAVLRVLRNDLAAMRAALERLPVEARATARRVLDQVRHEVCSPVETRLRLLLARAGVPEASHFAAALPREGRADVWPDLQWDSVRVAVEVDGPHHGEDEQHERDIRRRRRTEHHGWTQVVVSSREVMRQPDDVVRWVSDELRRAGLRW